METRLPPLHQFKMKKAFLNPEKILDQLDIKSNMIIADFGCGSGGFTIPLARKLENGLVHGLDVQEQPLSALKSRFLLENLNNIKLVKCDLETPKGSRLPPESTDMVFIPNVLFQAENRSAIIIEAYRVLKKKSKLIIIDWIGKRIQAEIGGEISKDEVIRLSKDQVFNFEKEFEAGQYHFGLIFRK